MLPDDRRIRFDADSHVMEPRDWLTPYADPAIRDRLRELPMEFDRASAERLLAERAADPDKEARARSRLGREGWKAYGAWDPAERSRALDILGYDAQLVFATFASTQYASDDLDLLYGGTEALHRALADFCKDDRRLLPVGAVPMVDPARDEALVRQALDEGMSALLVPSAYRDVSPTHPDREPVWTLLEEAGVPFMTHVGGGGNLVPKAYRNNGRPVPPDFLGGGENIRSKDFLSIARTPALFCQAMALDGVFERHPDLRGGVIEQGAEWIVTMLRAVDYAHENFKKGEPDLQALPLKASEYIRRQVKFTPFPFEDVGWLIRQGYGDLLLFSSDYPHLEGGADPVSKFEASLEGLDEDDKERFYNRNFVEMMGAQLPVEVTA